MELDEDLVNLSARDAHTALFMHASSLISVDESYISGVRHVATPAGRVGIYWVTLDE